MAIIPHLIVEGYGAFVGKKQGRITVSRKKKVEVQAPIMHLQSVLLIGEGVSISTDALMACCEKGIPVHMVDWRKKAYGGIYSAGLGGTVLTRRAQYAAYHDERALLIGRALARAKLKNQAGLLRYMAKYRKESMPDCYTRVRDAMSEILVHEARVNDVASETTHIKELREPLMLLEAHAARHYWRGFGALLPEGISWVGREGRGSCEPVNSIINYGYGVLYGEVERAVLQAGLDSYAGYVHADRPGKYSLVLDMIEPFRQPVVDRALLNFLGKGGTIEQEKDGSLTTKTCKKIANRVKERLDRSTRHNGKHFTLRHLLQEQAYALAGYLRGERVKFEPYIARW